MKPSPTYIHLGIAKTATSCLQTYLFRQHSQIHYFGKVIGEGMPASVRPALLSRRCRIQTLEPGDPREQNIRNQLKFAAEKQLVPVLSEEGFSCGWSLKKSAQALWLKTLLGNCKILLFIREPSSFIKSYYTQILKDFHLKQYMTEDWAKSIGHPPHYFDINEWMNAAWFSLNPPSQFLSYATTASIYANVFGKENVRIFIFEEFVRNPERFIRELCSHLKIDPDEGFGLTDGKRANDGITTGYINRLQEIEQSDSLRQKFRQSSLRDRRKMLDPDNLPGEKFIPVLSEKWMKKVTVLGVEQNRKLAKDWALPLEDYGYHV